MVLIMLAVLMILVVMVLQLLIKVVVAKTIDIAIMVLEDVVEAGKARGAVDLIMHGNFWTLLQI